MGNPFFQVFSVPKFFYTMSVSFINHGCTTYTLLNDQGEPLPGFYMNIHSFPNGDTPGKAVYVDARGTTDYVKFSYNMETRRFDVWHENFTTNRFTMTPVLVGQDIVGLDVQFSRIDDFVAHFALDLSEEGEELEVYDVLAPPVYLEELVHVGF